MGTKHLRDLSRSRKNSTRQNNMDVFGQAIFFKLFVPETAGWERGHNNCQSTLVEYHNLSFQGVPSSVFTDFQGLSRP